MTRAFAVAGRRPPVASYPSPVPVFNRTQACQAIACVCSVRSLRSQRATATNRATHRPDVASTTVPSFANGTRASSVPRFGIETSIIGAAILAVGGVLATRIRYVPMWDGYEYASAINRALLDGFQRGDLRLAGHASQAFAAPAIAAQALAPGQSWPILALNVVLWLVSIAGIWRLSTMLFPHPDLRVERSLVTAAFAAQPALLAAVVQPGLDLPVVPWFLWTAVFLLRGRWVWAALTGIALTFTKETGVLLYAVLAAAIIIWRPGMALGTQGARAQAARRLAILVVPGLVFAVYLLYRAHAARGGEPVVWNAGTSMIGQSLIRQLLVPRLDRYVVTSLALMFILNFAWIATLGIGIGFTVVAMAIGAERARWKQLAQSFAGETGFIALVLAGTTFALTRFATYANARYYLVVAPLLSLLLCAALLRVRASPLVRRAVLGLYALVSFASAVRTIDPVSRGLFGTFPFGDRELLRLTSITHECCARGRDQLGYNLEFTTLEALMDDALAATQAGDSTLIVLPDSTNWRAVPLLDARTSRRTIDSAEAVVPLVVETGSAALNAHARPSGFYLALPNGQAQRGLTELAPAFVIGPERRFSRGPYQLSAYRLTPRAN